MTPLQQLAITQHDILRPLLTFSSGGLPLEPTKQKHQYLTNTYIVYLIPGGYNWTFFEFDFAVDKIFC